jgi:cell wall-associated NlpC family hydrolase
MAKLTSAQRRLARNRAVEAALLGYRKRERVHYTQGAARWSGIKGKRSSAQGEFPFHADCSAYVTWCLWNALYLMYRKPDVVNGAGWRGGFTGTQVEHGRRIRASAAMLPGDLVFYANRGFTPTHVAICVGRKAGRPMVVSHGSESGPLFLPFDYRRRIQMRRYIHDGI